MCITQSSLKYASAIKQETETYKENKQLLSLYVKFDNSPPY